MNTDPLRSMGWYPNHNGRDCFGSSLANLLLFRGDVEMAERVYRNYQNYDRGLPDEGIDFCMVAKAVRDLTDGRYEGTLYCNPRMISQDTPMVPELEKRLRSILREEISSCRIRPASEKKSYQFPAIFLAGINQSEGAHAFVVTGQCCDRQNHILLDNGKVKYFPPNVPFQKIIGILQVSPT